MASLGVLKFRPTFLKNRWPLLPGAFLSLLRKQPLTPSCFWNAFSVCGGGVASAVVWRGACGSGEWTSRRLQAGGAVAGGPGLSLAPTCCVSAMAGDLGSERRLIEEGGLHARAWHYGAHFPLSKVPRAAPSLHHLGTCCCGPEGKHTRLRRRRTPHARGRCARGQSTCKRQVSGGASRSTQIRQLRKELWALASHSCR